MIELPEALTLARQLRREISGKKVGQVYPPSYGHKFTWFYGQADNYDNLMKGCTVTDTTAFGIYVEIDLGETCKFNFNDGINVRLYNPGEQRPERYQLMIEFTDGTGLAFTVAMYGGFACHQGELDNKYYLLSKAGRSPLSAEFSPDYFRSLIAAAKPSMSAKAFLATEQRIPGLGNGVLQDILLSCRIHPKRKLSTLSEADKDAMFRSVKSVLADITAAGGRDTEKDLYGQPGRYLTRFSKNTCKGGCPVCGGTIEKQAFLGGTIYTCAHCQPL